MAQQGGHIAGISGLITALLLQTFLEWQIATRGLGMIAALPDRVLAWFGQNAPGQGDSDHTAAATTGAVALASRGTPGAIPTRALPPKPPKDTLDNNGRERK